MDAGEWVTERHIKHTVISNVKPFHDKINWKPTPNR